MVTITNFERPLPHPSPIYKCQSSSVMKAYLTLCWYYCNTILTFRITILSPPPPPPHICAQYFSNLNVINTLRFVFVTASDIKCSHLKVCSNDTILITYSHLNMKLFWRYIPQFQGGKTKEAKL